MAKKRRSRKVSAKGAAKRLVAAAGKARRASKGKRASRKMPPEVLAHFAQRTLNTIKSRGIKPKLLTNR